MKKIAIISGSARAERESHKVALALHQKLEEKKDVTPIMLDVKAYNFPNLEYRVFKHPNPPKNMLDFQAKLKEADAFILVSPEYNSSYSGALKNTMDHFYKPYNNKPFGIATVSSGRLGGVNAMRALQQYILVLKGFVYHSALLTSKVQDMFDTNGDIADEGYDSRMDKFIDGFVEFADKINSADWS